MDVVTPIVDDPRTFGAIAACNALSDVYAMGGRPEFSLTFLGLPTDILGLDVAREVLAGVHEVCGRARCAVVGGHTMKDSEPKCGLSVVGSVEPEAVWSQRFAKPGDALVLTKAIGTGLIGQAIRKGDVDSAWLEAAVARMTRLNDVACEIGRRHAVRAATDVTGFGLLGHLRNLVEASEVSVRLRAGDVPVLPGAEELARAGAVPGGTRRNLAHAASVTRFDEAIDETRRLLLADAQTSGGLLLALPEDRAESFVRELVDRGETDATLIGSVLSCGAPTIEVVA